MQQVERCLNSFDDVKEWADFIKFLKQLLKVSDLASIVMYKLRYTAKTFQSYMQFKEIPRKLIVAKRLAQCLNPALPTGVHQLALEVYVHILAVSGVCFHLFCFIVVSMLTNCYRLKVLSATYHFGLLACSPFSNMQQRLLRYDLSRVVESMLNIAFLANPSQYIRYPLSSAAGWPATYHEVVHSFVTPWLGRRDRRVL